MRSTAGLIILFKRGSREAWIDTADCPLSVMLWIYDGEVLFGLNDSQRTRAQQVELKHSPQNAVCLTSEHTHTLNHTHFIQLEDTVASKPLKPGLLSDILHEQKYMLHNNTFPIAHILTC